MRARVTLAIAMALATSPAVAQPSDKPITDREPNAVDVATTPMSDLNLRKTEIPPLLIDAQDRPYDTAGLSRCSAIASKVGELDAILGDDIDLPATRGRTVQPGKIAQSVVGSFIPFRGVIRELSGANDQQRRLQLAIQAGVARRAFLKGLGQARNCRYPARAATAQAIAEHEEALARTAKSEKPDAQTPAKAEVSTGPRQTSN
jgi:hypothetical protein